MFFASSGLFYRLTLLFGEDTNFSYQDQAWHATDALDVAGYATDVSKIFEDSAPSSLPVWRWPYR